MAALFKDLPRLPAGENTYQMVWRAAYESALKASGPVLIQQDMDKAIAFADRLVKSFKEA